MRRYRPAQPNQTVPDRRPARAVGPGRSFETLNPATEQVIATIAEGDKADLATPLPQRAAPSGRCARRKSIASALLIAAAVDRSTAMVPRP
jgi:acyl-CoA reductase-like NAD-dependent aldehyde dehydrogenase